MLHDIEVGADGATVNGDSGHAGRASLHEHARQLLRTGHRVYVMDPFYFGESKVDQAAYLFALMVATVGDAKVIRKVLSRNKTLYFDLDRKILISSNVPLG